MGNKLIAYVPVLNIIIGLGRVLIGIGFFINAKKDSNFSFYEKCKQNRLWKYLIGRGIVEILGFGVITMALDFGKATATFIIIKQQSLTKRTHIAWFLDFTEKKSKVAVKNKIF